MNSMDAEVTCPYEDENYSCDSKLHDREIKSVSPAGALTLSLAASLFMLCWLKKKQTCTQAISQWLSVSVHYLV